ncbi:SH3 domain-containing protein [Pelagibacteraceae bacterium]|jgi:SH3-like domain-containing protein|nr:SH3 domain-containing protein [Pelagibacteraceae bacterium]MDC1130616.1 SH3 domain-containing protein [Pelagibacteraceae bacterium]
MQKIIFISFILLFSNLDLASAKDNNFLTLRYDIVNLRQGPGKDYPIKIFYKKKFLPVQIKDSSDNFRKVKDHENNSGWIHISQLTKKKAAIVTGGDLIMFKSNTIYSNPIVLLKEGRLVKIDKCKLMWCKVRTGNFKGWVKNDDLWGLF